MIARMVELVDTEDLKSSGIISRAGSSPASSMPNRERARVASGKLFEFLTFLF